MIVILYNHRTQCPARTSGRVLARLAGCGLVSIKALAEHRGITTLYGGRR